MSAWNDLICDMIDDAAQFPKNQCFGFELVAATPLDVNSHALLIQPSSRHHQS